MARVHVQGIGREELVAVASGVEGLEPAEAADERRARRTGRPPPARNRKADRLTELVRVRRL